MVDSLFADVSSFQVPVNDAYPYQIFSFRSNDGTFRDPNFAQNYRWAVNAADEGRISCFIVYMYCRTDAEQTAQAYIDMVQSLDGPHPKMISMLDVESGGNPGGDGSDWINRTYWRVADWLGDRKRVIGYANEADFFGMWCARPDGLRVIGAGYGRNPNLPGQIAHQYTDGQGFGGGLPEGCPPFGNCDMNAADGLSPQQFAVECGVAEEGLLMALSDAEQQEVLTAARQWNRGWRRDQVDYVPGGENWGAAMLTVVADELTKTITTPVDFDLLDEDTPNPLPSAPMLGQATNADARAYEARQIARETLDRLDDLIKALKAKDVI